MSEREKIRYIIDNQRSLMTFDDYIDFFIFIFPIFFIAIGFSILYCFIRFETDFLALIGSLASITLGSFLFYFTRKRLSERNDFEQICLKDELSIEEIAKRVQDNFRLKDLIVNSELKMIIAYTKLTAFSWGEVLTVILNNNSILINSRPTGQPITVVKDRKNVEKVKQLFL